MNNIQKISNLSQTAKAKIDTSMSINLDFYDVEVKLKAVFTSEEEMSRLYCDMNEDRKTLCLFDDELRAKFIKAIKTSLSEVEIEVVSVVDYVEFK